MDALTEISPKSYLKSKLIRILKSMCIFNYKGAKRIQKSIMCRFQNIKYKNMIMTAK